MRLAWFSPMPPVRTGIAACSAELVSALRSEHEIDVFIDAGAPNGSAAPRNPAAGAPVSAHEFVWRHRRVPYDLTVFQVGNSSHHDYIWPYLFRYPGMAVLHDAHLHHARAAALLRTRRAGDYRREFAASHPEASPDSAELAIAGFDNHLYYAWPMRRLIARASKMTTVSTAALAAEVGDEAPGAVIETIRLGHGTLLDDRERRERGARARAALHVPADAVVFGVFGGLTPEKRLPQILEAFRVLRTSEPRAYLLLGGAPASHYDAVVDARARGLAVRSAGLTAGTAAEDAPAPVIVTGYLEGDDALTDAIAACDVIVNLRWPTARETSGPWLRSLAAGVPTVTMDLVHTRDVPSLDPRTWQPRDNRDVAAVTVALDILDEDHSLRLAMRRLASDPDLRTALAGAGRSYWERNHSLERMLEDYRRLLPAAAAIDAPAPVLPPHLVNDGDLTLRELLQPFDLAAFQADFWSTLGQKARR